MWTVRAIDTDTYDLLNQTIAATQSAQKDQAALYDYVSDQLERNMPHIVAQKNLIGFNGRSDYTSTEGIEYIRQQNDKFREANTSMITSRDNLVTIRKGIGWVEGPQHQFQDILGPAAGVGVGLAVAP
jgi:hypothetical protein